MERNQQLKQFNIELKPDAVIAPFMKSASLNESRGWNVELWLKQMISLGFISPGRPENVSVYTKHHCVPKKGGKTRIVGDFHPLNAVSLSQSGRKIDPFEIARSVSQFSYYVKLDF